nr:hypothetical protein CFP56_62743 [Quercus suber]
MLCLILRFSAVSGFLGGRQACVQAGIDETVARKCVRTACNLYLDFSRRYGSGALLLIADGKVVVCAADGRGCRWRCEVALKSHNNLIPLFTLIWNLSIA